MGTPIMTEMMAAVSTSASVCIVWLQRPRFSIISIPIRVNSAILHLPSVQASAVNNRMRTIAGNPFRKESNPFTVSPMTILISLNSGSKFVSSHASSQSIHSASGILGKFILITCLYSAIACKTRKHCASNDDALQATARIDHA
ncbi:hypothetical protein D3C80_1255960 [compost metagenome]